MEALVDVHPNALPGPGVIICDGVVIQGGDVLLARKLAGEETAPVYVIERPDGLTIEDVIHMLRTDTRPRAFVWKEA